MLLEKIALDRQEHISQDGIPACQRPTIPGVISQRACSYYGARWVLAPIKNTLHIVHAPADCAFYGQNVRKKNYQILSTDLNQFDVIFGAEGKLERCIKEAAELFKEKDAIFVYSTCTAEQIGENIEKVAKRVQPYIDKPIVPVIAPGFGGYSQADGHHIAQKAIAKHILNNLEKEGCIENGVNLIGEYDVMGENKIIEDMLKKLGVRVICSYTGNCSIPKMKMSTNAELNILLCKSSGLFLAQWMKERFSIPFIEASFYGIENTIRSVERIASFFNREKEAKRFVWEEHSKIKDKIEFYQKRLKSKKAIVFLGGSRIGAMSKAFKELGLEIIVCGSQFGCDHDYEKARNDLPRAILIDDANHSEIEEMIFKLKPDIFIGGTKERFLSHKFGVPFLLFPQETDPYAGFEGFVNLARDLYKCIFAPVWRLI